MKKWSILALTLFLTGFLCHAQSAGSYIVSKNNIFLGLNGSAGVPLLSKNWDTSHGPIKNTKGIGGIPAVGLDFAYPVSRNFAVGFYASAGLGALYLVSTYVEGAAEKEKAFAAEFKGGLLMLVGNVNRRPFIIGIAPLTGIIFNTGKSIDGLPLELRFGRVITEHFYMTGNMEAAIFSGGVNGPVSLIMPSLTFGYHFGSKLKAKTF